MNQNRARFIAKTIKRKTNSIEPIILAYFQSKMQNSNILFKFSLTGIL